MKQAQAGRLLRWFLLVWLGLIYLWGLQLIGVSLGRGALAAGIFPGVSASSQMSLQGTGGSVCVPLAPSLFAVLLFTGLMVGHASLYWFGLSGSLPRRWRLFYLAAQGLLAGLISCSLSLGRCAALAPPEDFLICLYLALIVGAISILERPRAIIGVVAGYLLLLIGNTVILEGRSPSQLSSQAPTQSVIWYAAMILFVLGYILIYLQQLRTHFQLQITHARLKASTAKIEELTRAYERQRLARELHDTLAQGLAGVAMQLEAANTHLAHHQITTARTIVQQAMLCAREALVEARGAIDDLRTQPADPPDISVALQKEGEHFTMTTGIPCRTAIPQQLCVSSPVHEHLLGIVREGFANITRHAQAHHVWISLIPNGEMLALEIGDDGRGFDLAVAAKAGHYGLIGMRERARLLGGSLTVCSTPGMGTRLQVHLPKEQGSRETPGWGQVDDERTLEGENLHA